MIAFHRVRRTALLAGVEAAHARHIFWVCSWKLSAGTFRPLDDGHRHALRREVHRSRQPADPGAAHHDPMGGHGQ